MGKRKAEEQGPQPPKKPQSGYGQFLSEKREEISATLLKEGADKSKILTLVAKRGGEMWKALGSEKQKPYNDKAAKLQEEWKKEFDEFKNDNPDFKKKAKKGKDAKAPRAPAGPYQQWMSANRDMLTAKVMKEKGVEKKDAFFHHYQAGKAVYEALPTAERQKWEATAKEAKEKFVEEKKAWKETHGADIANDKAAKKGKIVGKPKTPLGPYPLWISDNRELLYKTIMEKHNVPKSKAFLMFYKEGKPIYEALPAAERDRYEKKAQDAKLKYKDDMKVFKDGLKSAGA